MGVTMARLLTLVTLGLLLVACTTGGTPPDTDGSPTSSATSPTRSPGGSTTPREGGSIWDVDEEMIDAVVEQAAADAGVAADEISVVSADAVTWSDGSIGCPQEGMGYTQALVPGYRVILDVAGEEVHYHAGSDARFFACDDPQEPIDDGTVDR